MLDVRTLCLGLLSKHEASGYEIKKKLQEGPMCHFLEASFGSIYPALTRLASEGFVEARTEAQDGKPDKKVYAITEAGRIQLKEQMQQPPADDKYRSEFLFYILFSDLLGPERTSQLIDDQIDFYKRQIQMIHDCVEEIRTEKCDGTLPRGAEFAAQYGIITNQAVVDFLESHRQMVEGPQKEAAHRLEEVNG